MCHGSVTITQGVEGGVDEIHTGGSFGRSVDEGCVAARPTQVITKRVESAQNEEDLMVVGDCFGDELR